VPPIVPPKPRRPWLQLAGLCFDFFRTDSPEFPCEGLVAYIGNCYSKPSGPDYALPTPTCTQ